VLHKEILNANQLALLPILKDFKRNYYLVGGTAIALQIGHRRSIDFDLFTDKPIKHKWILEKLESHKLTTLITRRVDDQLNLIVNQVKFTFYQYPFTIDPNHKLESYIKMPDLLQLAAMKAYALGRRSKWKDYVDLYFLLKSHFSIDDICDEANRLFQDLFSEKQFRAQLIYFDDIDYTEAVDYLNEKPTDEMIKETLKEISLAI